VLHLVNVQDVAADLHLRPVEAFIIHHVVKKSDINSRIDVALQTTRVHAFSKRDLLTKKLEQLGS